MIPDIIDSKPTPIIIQIQNRNAHMPLNNESEYFEDDFLFLKTFIISDKEIKKYNINVQNVDVRIR